MCRDEPHRAPRLGGFGDHLNHWIRDILNYDDTRKFLKLAKEILPLVPHMNPPEVLKLCCRFDAVNCADALLNGKTRWVVDINQPCSEGLYPIHHAAKMFYPKFVQLCLQHGANINQRSSNNKLPLNEMLEGSLLYRPELMSWSPTKKNSIYTLISSFCRSRYNHIFKTLRLVALETEETEDVIMHYARDGKIIQLAALLFVARKKLTRPITAFDESISTPLTVEHEALLMAGRNLLEVFERVGDNLEEYIQRDDFVSEDQAFKDVRTLFSRAGLVLEPQDSNFNDSIMNIGAPLLGPDMPEYSSSHYHCPLLKMSVAKSLKRPTMSFVPNQRREFHTLRILKTNSTSNFLTLDTELKITAKRAEHPLSKALASKPGALFASVIKRLSRRG